MQVSDDLSLLLEKAKNIGQAIARNKTLVEKQNLKAEKIKEDLKSKNAQIKEIIDKVF